MIAMFRRIVLRDLEASTPVTECGYMNSAIAEPSARVAYVHCAFSGVTTKPVGLPVAGLGVLNFCAAVSKMWP